MRQMSGIDSFSTDSIAPAFRQPEWWAKVNSLLDRLLAWLDQTLSGLVLLWRLGAFAGKRRHPGAQLDAQRRMLTSLHFGEWT